MPSNKPKQAAPTPPTSVKGRAGQAVRTAAKNSFSNPITIIALIVATTACFIGWKNYNKSPELKLDYHRIVSLINPQIQAPSKLVIQSDGKPVNSPFIMLATLSNPGEMAVEKTKHTGPPIPHISTLR